MRGMLASIRPKLGGEPNLFGRTAREAGTPAPQVCPPRVEGARAADRPRSLPSLGRLPQPVPTQPAKSALQ